ncbi:putative muconate lactonizing enzyme [Byssothecium circinans]|uniref:Putative muconate lactonizing enzyme n=1 Tax=Byssothecium circinans TaxID=147558 RepID=A0A6A5TXD2_9PLEO|nr:putative muconate lactonizing enzyme [Byssothecium circinans]
MAQPTSPTPLKITRIDVYHTPLPYAAGVYHLSSSRTYTTFDATLVRLTTSTGLTGWGESTPFGGTFIAAHALGVRAGIAELAPHILGLDPRRVDRVNEAMDAALLGHEHAKTAIDVACWDLFGKAVGMPVCELLGGRTGVGLRRMSSLGVCSAGEMRERVRESRAKGYGGHSIKIDGADPQASADLIAAAVADRVPGEVFIADANCGLSVEVALRMLRLVPPGLDFVLESPCRTLRETVSLRRRTDVPILVDEIATDVESVVQIVAEDVADGVNLKISKVGGLTKARRVRDICLAAGYTMSVQDCWGSDVSFAAIVHLAQTIPERSLRCILDVRDESTIRIADCEYGVGEDGSITAPTAPGLGITPRLDVLGEPVVSYS